ncbi:hypothetical protein MKY24_16715 [Paenibacillus sp. FSL P2-0322]|uniref:hypothetical protein n=1 Tax=Paenibacillus sp. FSL P2-0322 TaxID=2921628 RepID=UPI0030CE3DA6
MIVGEMVEVIGDSTFRGQTGEVVGTDDDGFAHVRFTVWGNVIIAKIWINYLRTRPATLW